MVWNWYGHYKLINERRFNDILYVIEYSMCLSEDCYRLQIMQKVHTGIVVLHIVDSILNLKRQLKGHGSMHWKCRFSSGETLLIDICVKNPSMANASRLSWNVVYCRKVVCLPFPCEISENLGRLWHAYNIRMSVLQAATHKKTVVEKLSVVEKTNVFYFT